MHDLNKPTDIFISPMHAGMAETTTMTVTSLLESTKPLDMSETASTCSEDSAAIVSLYNSWSTSDAGSIANDDDDDGLQGVEFEMLPPSSCCPPIRPEELFECLKKRCRTEDLPPALVLRPRKRPNCMFLNYMGVTRLPPIPMDDVEPTLLATIGLDLGLDDSDELYPVCATKVRHDIDQDDEAESSVSAQDKLGSRIDAVDCILKARC
jgi:hypothetical protein